MLAARKRLSFWFVAIESTKPKNIIPTWLTNILTITERFSVIKCSIIPCPIRFVYCYIIPHLLTA